MQGGPEKIIISLSHRWKSYQNCKFNFTHYWSVFNV